MSNFLVTSSLIRNIIFTIFIVIIAFIANIVLRSLIKVPRKMDTRRGRTLVTVIRNVITILLIYITLQILFLILGINITPLIASASVIGIVVGIGAQSFLRDFFAGIYLISQSSIGIGDYIVTSWGVEGTVKNIGLKNLTLVGSTGTLYIIPNGQVNFIENQSYGKAKITIEIPVKLQKPIDNILEIFETVLNALKKNDSIKLSPDSKVIGIKKIESNGVVISTLLIINNSQREAIETEFNYRILKAFEKRKISIS